MQKDYLALLRGINVGGKNIIKMIALKTSFEKMGFEDVKTYIQSGNVMFRSDKSLEAIQNQIADQLKLDFNYESTVVVISGTDLARIVESAPEGFGAKPKEYRYDFIFLQSPLNAKEVIKEVRVREEVDTAEAGEGVLYFSRLKALRTKSYLSKIIETSFYKQLTIRNWNTTTKLLSLLQEKLES